MPQELPEISLKQEQDLMMNWRLMFALFSKGEVTDVMGLTETGWMGCQGLRLVWEIPGPAIPWKLAEQAFTLFPVLLSPQGEVLAQGRFPSGHEWTLLMLKIELKKNFYHSIKEGKMPFL